MKYKNGDRVILRNDIVFNNVYKNENGSTYYCEMPVYKARGKVITIQVMDRAHGYQNADDTSMKCITDGMIAGYAIEINMNPLF